MKRSGREGPGADIPSARVRFACEAGFLILVALLAAIAKFSSRTIIIVMAVAWLLVAIVERASSKATMAAADANEQLAPREDLPSGLSATDAREAYRWLFWRRGRTQAEPLSSPTAPLEERPSSSHVRRLDAEPPPMSQREPEPPPEGPAVTKRPLSLPGLQEIEPPAPGRPRRILQPRRAAAPPPPPTPPPARPLAREWNLWDLERRAREQAGHAERQEEWSALFTHLRGFATADGVLPLEFDELVRESFAELIEAA